MAGGKSGQLRIIGGHWRSRILRFRAVGGLRPTPQRVRETLFNWLAADIPDSRCLDLFAGSGALGLEALSRGAAHCCFVEKQRRSAEGLREHLQQLQCDGAQVICADALRLSRRPPPGPPFDVVFLDPPFGSDFLPRLGQNLEQGGWLAAGAHIYIEAGARQEPPELPAHWRELRDKCAGEVRFRLFVREG